MRKIARVRRGVECRRGKGDVDWRDELGGMKPEEAAVLTLLRTRLRKAVAK